MVAPGARVGDAELDRGIDGDEIPAVAEEQRVFVGGMLDGPQHVFRSRRFLAFVADGKDLHALTRESERRDPRATANAREAPAEAAARSTGTPKRSTRPCSGTPTTVRDVESQPSRHRPMTSGSRLRRTTVSAQVERKIDAELPLRGCPECSPEYSSGSRGARARRDPAGRSEVDRAWAGRPLRGYSKRGHRLRGPQSQEFEEIVCSPAATPAAGQHAGRQYPGKDARAAAKTWRFRKAGGIDIGEVSRRGDGQSRRSQAKGRSDRRRQRSGRVGWAVSQQKCNAHQTASGRAHPRQVHPFQVGDRQAFPQSGWAE